MILMINSMLKMIESCDVAYCNVFYSVTKENLNRMALQVKQISEAVSTVHRKACTPLFDLCGSTSWRRDSAFGGAHEVHIHFK